MVTRKLSEAERDEVVHTACSDEYCDQTPYEIVVDLLEKRKYIASASTFYRVLRERGLVHHRRTSKAPRNSARPPELMATGPNQVWSWDITYIRSAVAGLYFYAYMIIDVWSRKIVGWEIHNRESPELAAELFLRLSRSENLKGLRLHADNGNAMKAATMLMTFYRLGVMPSFSRPRVSDDNPYSESLFKTMKYHVEYPRFFSTIESARSWVADFVHWYNTKHRHSSIGYVAPQTRHEGSDLALFAVRNDTIDASRKLHPERWGTKVAVHGAERSVYLNPASEKRSA